MGSEMCIRDRSQGSWTTGDTLTGVAPWWPLTDWIPLGEGKYDWCLNTIRNLEPVAGGPCLTTCVVASSRPEWINELPEDADERRRIIADRVAAARKAHAAHEEVVRFDSLPDEAADLVYRFMYGGLAALLDPNMPRHKACMMREAAPAALGARKFKVRKWLMDTGCGNDIVNTETMSCLLYTSPSPRDLSTSRMPSSA